jgi:hypothetical protein
VIKRVQGGWPAVGLAVLRALDRLAAHIGLGGIFYPRATLSISSVRASPKSRERSFPSFCRRWEADTAKDLLRQEAPAQEGHRGLAAISAQRIFYNYAIPCCFQVYASYASRLHQTAQSALMLLCGGWEAHAAKDLPPQAGGAHEAGAPWG